MSFIEEPIGIRVEVRSGEKRLEWNQAPIDDSAVRAEIQALKQYLPVSAEIELKDGALARVVRIIPPGGPVRLTPSAELKGFLERGYLGRARELLDSLDPKRVERNKELMLFRIYAAQEIGDYPKLLKLPECGVVDAREGYDVFHDEEVGAEAAELFGAWLIAHREQLQLFGRISDGVGELPMTSWPLPVLFDAIEQSLNTPWPSDNFVPWLRRAQLEAPDDPRVILFSERAESRLREIEEREEQERQELLATRADFDEIERLFGVRLPLPLRAAWQRFYEGSSPLRFREVRKGEEASLLELAEDIVEEHGPEGYESLDVKKGLAAQVLPFAHGLEDTDDFALDLRHPRRDGDFPVLHIAHDSPEGITEWAESSADWLERGEANWEDDEEAADDEEE